MRKKKKTVSRRKTSKKVRRAPDTRPDGANEVLKPVGEADEKIAVGAGGTLFVPREDISIDVDGAEELSLAELRTKRLRRTKRNEWFILDPNSEYPVHLLEYTADPNGMDKQLYYVDPDLRPLIASELKPYRIFVIYSTLIKDFVLWYIKVTIGNSWYDSQLSMFNRPHEYFATHEINVRPDRPATQYRIRSREIRATELEWPTTDTGILLGEALQENFINSAEHELYRELTDGEVL